MGIASLLEPTFSAGVAGTVLGPVPSFVLKYLLRYISKQMSAPVESRFQQGRQTTCHTRNPCQPLRAAEGDEGCGRSTAGAGGRLQLKWGGQGWLGGCHYYCQSHFTD